MDPVLYHAHHTLRSDDMSFWLDLAFKAPGKTLELGCGTGRVVLRLIKDNLEVVGLDNDPEMLKYMRQALPPTLSHLAEIFERDMRSFDLGASFPLIILPCNTLSTFNGTDRLKIFQSVRKHLSSNGLFAFSIPNTLMLAELPSIGAEELEDEFVHPATNNPVYVYSSWERDADKLSFYWRYEHVFSNENITEAKNTTLHYLDPPQAYIAELRKCGLKPIAVYGDFYHAKFEPDSAYFIVLAKAVTEETP